MKSDTNKCREHDKSQRNDVLDEVLLIVLKEPDYISSSQSTRQGYVRAVNDMQRAIEKLKNSPGCDFCGEKEIWDERLNLCHACAKDHYS